MAGLKAFSTWSTQEAIEQCRQCCGGHGFSAYNALGTLVTDFAVMVTWEGDNTVMAQQTARYLIASFRKMTRGEKLTGSVEYLEELPTGRHKRRAWKALTEEDVLDSVLQIEAMRHLASSCVQAVAIRLDAAESTLGKTDREAWNACQVELINAARVHVSYNVACQFIQQVKQLEQQADKSSAALADVLRNVCHLFVVNQLNTDLARFLQDQYFAPEQAMWVQRQLLRLCETVRSNAVPLVDAFNFTDTIVNACIGRQDGDIYTSCLDMVTHRTQPTPYFASQIKPMFQGERLE